MRNSIIPFNYNPGRCLKSAALLVLLCFCISMRSQVPAIAWKKCLGGTGIERANSVCQTSDGGYVVAGFSNSNGGDVTGHIGLDDFWIVKLSSAGAIQWKNCYGGTDVDQAYCIQQTSDGGYIAAGYTKSTNGQVTGAHGNWDIWVIKLDNAGTLLWQKTYGGSNLDAATSIMETSDGGFVIGGYTQSTDGDVTGHHSPGKYDVWVVKINSAGTLQWQKALGGENYDNAGAVRQTSDGGYIVTAYTNSGGGDLTGYIGGGDFWVAKLDNAGAIQWQAILGGTGWDVPNDVIQLSDGNYLVVGFTQSVDGDAISNHGGQDILLVKLDNAGNKLWAKCFGGTYTETGTSVIQTSDGNYVLAGYTNSNDGDVSGFHGTPGNIAGGTIAPDYWALKTDNNGNILWQKAMGGTSQEMASCIRQTSDGGYILSGYTTGNTANNGDVTGFHVNTSNPNASGSDYWIVKLSTPTALEMPASKDPGMTLYPNPANRLLYITSSVPLKQEACIFDAVGKHINVTTADGAIDVSELPPGLYILELRDKKNNALHEKFLKQD